MFYDDFEEPPHYGGYTSNRISNRKLSDSEVDRRIAAAYDGRIKRLGTYRNKSVKLRVTCVRCDTEFWQAAECLFRGNSTPCRCDRSREWVRRHFGEDR